MPLKGRVPRTLWAIGISAVTLGLARGLGVAAVVFIFYERPSVPGAVTLAYSAAFALAAASVWGLTVPDLSRRPATEKVITVLLWIAFAGMCATAAVAMVLRHGRH